MTAREALRSRSFWSLVLIFSTQGIGVSALMAHQIPYFQSIGFSPEQAASTVAAMFFLSGIGRLGAGIVLEFLDWRLLMSAVLVAQVAAFVLLVNITAYWQALVFAAIMGISFGSTIPARPILVGLLFGTRAFGSIQGLLQAGAVAAGVVGPVVLGWVFDVYGTYVPGILGFTAIAAVAIPLPFLLAKRTATRPAGAQAPLPSK